MDTQKMKDVAIRALKTFAQAFISAISVDTLLGVTDLDMLKKICVSMLIASTAAGISAVWNSALKMIEGRGMLG